MEISVANKRSYKPQSGEKSRFEWKSEGKGGQRNSNRDILTDFNRAHKTMNDSHAFLIVYVFLKIFVLLTKQTILPLVPYKKSCIEFGECEMTATATFC